MAKYIDYSSRAVIHARAAAAPTRRGGNDHEYVCGGFRLQGDTVQLWCVEAGPAWNITERLTPQASSFARWRTKQAAWQWLRLRPHLSSTVHVIHLGRLDVLAQPPAT